MRGRSNTESWYLLHTYRERHVTNRNWKYITACLLLSILTSSAVAQDAKLNRRKGSAGDSSANHTSTTVQLNGSRWIERPDDKYVVACCVPPVMVSVSQAENPDVKAVRDTVLIRFKNAFDANDVKELEKVWRGMRKIDKDEWNKIFTNKDIGNIQISDQCDFTPVLKGDLAELVCKETIASPSDRV